MTRIDDLIGELCPDGVEFRPLSDLLDYQQPGKYLVASKSYDDRYPTPVLTAGQTFILGYTDENNGIYPASPDKPVIIFDDFTTAFKWVDFPFKAKSSAMKMLTPTRNGLVSLRYAYYVMQTIKYAPQDHTRQWIARYSQFRVPVPPLEVQREIVKMLDLCTSLRTELEAELKARRLQYEHYSRVILGHHEEDGRMVRLGDVADVLVGYPFKSSDFVDDQSGTALLRGDNVAQGFLKHVAYKRWRRDAGDSLQSFELQAGDIVLAMDRPWIPAGLKWARIPEEVLPALLVQRVARLRADAQLLNQRFLGYVIGSAAFVDYVLQSQTGNTVPHISGGQIEAFEFSLPTLSDQIRMANTLNKFDMFVSDLSIGLPAELDARRKQYEYYRDRLLTFKELAA